MERFMLKSKIHMASVTDKSLHYEGSITIDAELMEAADILPWEKVLVANAANGKRFETYAIAGKAGQGQIQLNGATARLGEKGDRIIIFTFGTISTVDARDYAPKVVHVDEHNRIVEKAKS